MRLLTHVHMKQWSRGGELGGRAQVNVILPVLFCAFTDARHFIHSESFHPSYQHGTVIKNLPANAGDTGEVGLIPGSGRYPGGGNGNPLQYSCLENLMDRGAWRATVHGVTKSQTQLNDWAHTYHHKRFYQPHFTDEEPKVQRGCMTYQKSHRQRKC